MAWTWYQRSIALIMVVTGSINTLATEWADLTESVGKDGVKRKFVHPFLQACGMFLGELMCLVAFKIFYRIYKRREENTGKEMPTSIKGNQDFNPVIFYIPATCDLIGTSTMYIAMTLTNASSFQMLRGAVIIFTGLFSVAFLHKRLKVYEWTGIGIVIAGLICVGVADVLDPDPSQAAGEDFDPNKRLTGDLLIVMAQIVVATQMVVEEKFVAKHNINPLQGVGWEGFFGFITLSILLIPMYYIQLGPNHIFVNPEYRFEDAIDGFVQIKNSWQVATGLTGTIVSIAFFNFAGLNVTKELSATTRMVLDSIRIFVVWIVALMVKWETFSWIKVIGFIILIVGMCLYNDVVIRPLYNKYRRKDENEIKPLVEEDAESSRKTYLDSPGPKSSSVNI